jgi:hypothetical protein
MYIDNSGHGYYRGTEQHHSRAPFLILVQPPGIEGSKKPIRALVREVAMHQCGHWMMGSARAFGHKILLSGSYGGDGLPTSVPQEVYDRATPVPQELIDAWNKGGGWNSAGSEAPAMARWAVKTLLKEKA